MQSHKRYVGIGSREQDLAGAARTMWQNSLAVTDCSVSMDGCELQAAEVV